MMKFVCRENRLFSKKSTTRNKEEILVQFRTSPIEDAQDRWSMSWRAATSNVNQLTVIKATKNTLKGSRGDLAGLAKVALILLIT